MRVVSAAYLLNLSPNELVVQQGDEADRLRECLYVIDLIINSMAVGSSRTVYLFHLSRSKSYDLSLTTKEVIYIERLTTDFSTLRVATSLSSRTSHNFASCIFCRAQRQNFFFVARSTASEMTYCVSGGALNSTHTLSRAAFSSVFVR